MYFSSAPGCSFKDSRFSTDLKKHLARKTWCPCKDAGWTVEKGKEGKVDGRKTRYNNGSVTNTGDITAQRDVNINNTTININVNVDGKVLPSGSEAERAYLQQHAASIYKNILAGINGPDADILSRFVRETWLSEVHEKLNNVLSLRNGKHQYLVLQMQGDIPQIETLAGRDAPEQLVALATKTMHQFAVDTCGGYDASKCPTLCYGQTCDTREEAEELRERSGGKGFVRQLFLAGSGRHEGISKDFWIVMRDMNEKPAEEPELMKEGCVVAQVKEHLATRPKARKRVGQVISTQLQDVEDRRGKKAKMKGSKPVGGEPVESLRL